MKIGFLLFETIHNKSNIGSSRIRGHWLIKHWKEAELYHIGKDYEAIIYQKIYRPDMAQPFKGVKILDLCDPDWLDMSRDPWSKGYPFYEMLNEMDAVTCSSKGIYEFVKTITDKPVHYVPDRIDFEFNKEKKIHKGKAKSCVWYGYSHNLASMKQVTRYLLDYGLNITIIADDFSTFATKDDQKIRKYEKFVKWDLKTVNSEIIKSDFVVMPPPSSPRGIYKSNNKLTNAWSLNMPVATCPTIADEAKIGGISMERLLDEKERIKESDKRLKEVKENYDCKQSVEQMKEIINEVSGSTKRSK